MRIKVIWRNFINRFSNSLETDRDGQKLNWAKACLSVNKLVDREDLLDWLDSLIFDEFQRGRVEAKKGNLFEFGYYVGAMDQAEAIANAIRKAEQGIVILEEKRK